MTPAFGSVMALSEKTKGEKEVRVSRTKEPRRIPLEGEKKKGKVSLDLYPERHCNFPTVEKGKPN